jgi:proline dehydrogenase
MPEINGAKIIAKGKYMLRSFLLYLSKAGWAKSTVTNWPVAWKAASRFVAGDNLQDGIRMVKELNATGIQATLDHLGEHTTNRAEAVRATQAILELLDAIEQAQVRSNVSVKLTQIGITIDEQLCLDNLKGILEYANQRGNFVRIDMEESKWTETTLRVYRKVFPREFKNTGIVIQSSLYRSEEDVRRLAETGNRIRLCKGAYLEPPELAYPKKADVDRSYDRLASILIDGAIAAGKEPASTDGKIPPMTALATHDPARIAYARTYAERVGLPKEALEFQMLHGIRRELQESLALEGYPVRVYVPYGTEWYPYFTRRLAERPANLWFFLSNYFRK